MDIFTDMSDLQLSLIIIGAIIIVGVAIFNWVQQQRYQRKVQAAFEYKHDDVLLDADSSESMSERIEPVFNKSPLHESDFESHTQPDAYHSHAQDVRKNAPISPTLSTSSSNATSNSAMPTSVLIDYDNSTNYIVNIRSDSPIANTYIAKLLQRKFDFGKKLRSSQSLNFTMKLPTKNGEPDFKVMETFISAIHKLIIKDVVLYTDSKIENTEIIINKEK